MILKNCIGIETRYGYRTFELYEGDLLDPRAKADLLAVSSFAGSYTPDPGTLFESLWTEWGLTVNPCDAELNFRIPLSIWISRPLEKGHFARLLCVEITGSALRVEEAIANIFVGVAILDAKGCGPRSIAMPVLGSGNQALDPNEMIAILVPEAQKALQRCPSLERIRFIDRNRAKVAGLDEAMNEFLKRSKVLVPKGALIEDLLQDICTSIDTLVPLVPIGHQPLFGDMRRVLGRAQARSFEVGMLARRLVEFIVNDLLQESKPSPDIFQRIEKLASCGIAPWIRSYMHTLRLFGNESAHEKMTEDRIPRYVSEEDLVICLFCTLRLLNFWHSMKQGQSDAGA